MDEVTTRNLQVRLLILVFLAFIPALSIFWYASRELRELQLDAKEQELAFRANEVATDYQRLIHEGQSFLATLSEFPQVSSLRFPACTEQLEKVLEHTDQYTTISVIGMDGYLACGSITPENALYLGDRAYFVRATSRDLFSVGEFALGRITGKSVVGIAQPLEVMEGASSVLAASIDLNALAERSRGGNLPEGHTLSVLDRNRRVMLRLPRTGNFTLADSVGAVAEESFPGPPEGSGVKINAGTDLDGVERLFAVAPLRNPTGGMGGYVAIGRTMATLTEEVDQVVTTQLRFLAVGGLVLLLLAWVLGHFWLARRPAGKETPAET